jgi:hypothetical protein
MRPDTWLPTSTVTVAERLPEALTREMISPRSTAAVWNCGAGAARPTNRHATRPPTITRAATIQGRRRRKRDGESVADMTDPGGNDDNARAV